MTGRSNLAFWFRWVLSNEAGQRRFVAAHSFHLH